MAWSRPASLNQFCQRVLPQLVQYTDGDQTLDYVRRVVASDRWNSFDQFHQTSRTLEEAYSAAGAGVEICPLQTGGQLGSGRWVIHEANDVRRATLKVVAPVRRKILDYRDNPWHIVQWSGSTPKGGMECRLVVVDEVADIDRRVEGSMVLTRLDPRINMARFASQGAVGVITDAAVADLPDAHRWMKFGWGGIPMEHAAVNLVGLVLSENEGWALRQLHREKGTLTVRVDVDVHRYVGHHNMVSGLIRGGDDPQDEVWVLAHSNEPGALDNASGVGLCVEIARVLEGLIAAGALPRPKRTIRLLNAYECYGFFKYLEDSHRLQTPMAGVVIDTVGHQPELCGGRLEWHATIPMSAGFVDRVGAAILRQTLKLVNPGYRLHLEPFMSTADTLIGDPKYGFPAPWITTHHRAKNRASAVYHTSADTMETVNGTGLETCAAAMAGYLYYLANAGTREVVELARAETKYSLGQLQKAGLAPEQARHEGEAHRENMTRLRRFLWGGEKGEIEASLGAGEQAVRQAIEQIAPARPRRRRQGAAGRVPRRKVVISPSGDNTPPEILRRINGTGLSAWALFWADGERTVGEIAQRLSCEYGRPVEARTVGEFFAAHQDLGYVDLIEPGDMVGRSQLVADLRALGVETGMDLMVHSSLGRIGHVVGGPTTVIEALLQVLGKRGTLMMPSFNHGAGRVFNPLVTPSTNGAIPDALWRRPEAVRSVHPSHALAAIGPRAEEFCRGHLEAGIWAQDSPIGRLVHGGGHIMSLGVDHNSSTAYHVAEESVPCSCIDPFGNIDRIVSVDGEVSQVQGLAWRAGTCPVSPGRLDETLTERGLQRRGPIGGAPSGLARGLDLWEVRREHLAEVCPSCTIKPGIRS
ncbi:MAG: M28 family peptidase [Candidatus Latescibacteria bacterium]|nr:M28 family peptidase [Candidatus Latescibacterota bacterium]